MDHLWIYHRETPDLLRCIAETLPMRRLREVGMNCGCEYTSFPLFRRVGSYSRYTHSLGVGLIVWHFTEDPAQAAAGLLHDIATPAFAHVVDFLHGDSLKQETTEAGTAELVRGSEALCSLLREYGLRPEDVNDYHRYPIADNDAPGLSADRLEYTLGNGINYGFCTAGEADELYRDLTIAQNEAGAPELCFGSEPAAERFGLLSVRCSAVYASAEDRYAMQMLAELLCFAIGRGVLTEQDLYQTEPRVIAALRADSACRERWERFRSFAVILRAEKPQNGEMWRQIFAKKRQIDPLIAGLGRLSTVSGVFREKREEFLSERQDVWLMAEPGTEELLHGKRGASQRK